MYTMHFTISSAYQWKDKTTNKSTNSETALKEIVAQVNNYFKKRKLTNKDSYLINYKRLRATAGNNMLESIINRIKTSNVVIIDITHPNENVFLELGIAIGLISSQSYPLNLYLIKDITNSKNVIENLPSDLQGFFISGYTIQSGKAVFKDNGSLRMNIIGDVKEYYDILVKPIDSIDEINHYDQ